MDDILQKFVLKKDDRLFQKLVFKVKLCLKSFAKISKKASGATFSYSIIDACICI